jgi:hypothetical protein
MDRPKGLETLEEVSGLIVQRRLHQQATNEEEGRVFFKEPIHEEKVRYIAVNMDLDIDYVYGKLPHFPSTLVRRAPGSWRSFLKQGVSKYLDARPHLIHKLMVNLEADAEAKQKQQTKEVLGQRHCSSAGLEAVNALQYEHEISGLLLSIGHRYLKPLEESQGNTYSLLEKCA